MQVIKTPIQSYLLITRRQILFYFATLMQFFTSSWIIRQSGCISISMLLVSTWSFSITVVTADRTLEAPVIFGKSILVLWIHKMSCKMLRLYLNMLLNNLFRSQICLELDKNQKLMLKWWCMESHSEVWWPLMWPWKVTQVWLVDETSISTLHILIERLQVLIMLHIGVLVSSPSYPHSRVQRTRQGQVMPKPAAIWTDSVFHISLASLYLEFSDSLPNGKTITF